MVPGLTTAVLAQAAAGVAGVVLVAAPSTWSRSAPALAEAPAPPAATAGWAEGTGSSSGASSPRPATPAGAGRPHPPPRAAGTATAPTEAVLRPPFPTGTRVAGCFPPGPQCKAQLVSRPEDGYSSALVAVTSPGDGTAPGVGSAQGYAGLIAELPLRAPAHRAVITAVVDVTRGDVGHEVGPLAVPALASRAQLALQEVAIHSVCGGWGCFATAVASLARLDGADGPGTGPAASSAASGRRRLQVVLANPGGLMPAGIVYVAVQLYARAELGNMSPSGASPDVGTVHADAALRVEEINATIT